VQQLSGIAAPGTAAEIIDDGVQGLIAERGVTMIVSSRHGFIVCRGQAKINEEFALAFAPPAVAT